MAPQRKKAGSGRKKRSNKPDRDEKLSSCEGCSVKLGRKNFVYCECTKVRFCSKDCLRDRPHDGCPGPPASNVDVFPTAGDLYGAGQTQAGIRTLLSSAEYQRTVQKPLMEYVKNRCPDPSQLTAWDYADMANEGETLGNQACSYMAAVKFKHNVLGAPRRNGRGGKVVANNNEAGNVPILEAQSLAFEYFEKAAKLGHGWSMKSLGGCFDEGVGCRKNHRRSIQWLWRASLRHTDGAIEDVDERALLPKDVMANIHQLHRMAQMCPSGQTIGIAGPNIGCLLLAFGYVAEREKYSLPPFAGDWATGTVNNEPVDLERQGKPRTPLIGSDAVKQFRKKVCALEARGTSIQVQYGRRGVAKQATAMCLSGVTVSRAIDNQLFLVPPRAACDERVNDDSLNNWRRQLLYPADRNKVLFPACVHNEHDEKHYHLYCLECEAEAKTRLDAVSRGSVALSIDEALDMRGQAAIYRNSSDGTLKIETWKNYGVGEAECVLAILAASGIPAYVTPIFIAQDPNLYWPLIADHGSIRAALEFVAPHKDWDEQIGKTRRALTPEPIIAGCQSSQCLWKCGHGLCTNLYHFKDKQFLCSGCERRKYCSEKCQLDDWTLHKLECKKAVEANPRIDDQNASDRGTDIDPLMKYSLDVKEGDDAVVHGLKARTVGVYTTHHH